MQMSNSKEKTLNAPNLTIQRITLIYLFYMHVYIHIYAYIYILSVCAFLKQNRIVSHLPFSNMLVKSYFVTLDPEHFLDFSCPFFILRCICFCCTHSVGVALNTCACVRECSLGILPWTLFHSAMHHGEDCMSISIDLCHCI